MIASKNSHQNLSDCIQFLFKKGFEFDFKKRLFLVKKWAIQVILTMSMLTHSSEIIFNSNRYTGVYQLQLIDSYFLTDIL